MAAYHYLTFAFPDGCPTSVHVYLTLGSDTEDVLAAIAALSAQTTTQGATNMADVTAQMASLRAAVANGTTVTQGMATFVHGLADRLEAAARGNADPAEIQALADQLRADTNTLTAAMLEGTPVEEEPPVDTEPPAEPEPEPEPEVDPSQEGSTARRRR